MTRAIREKALPCGIPAVGEVFTIAGRFYHQTVWERVTRQPRRLQRYRVTRDWRNSGLDLGRAELIEDSVEHKGQDR